MTDDRDRTRQRFQALADQQACYNETARTLEDELGSLSEAQLHELLTAFRTPKLDLLRADMPVARTSAILAFIASPELIMDAFEINPATMSTDDGKAVAAAMLALRQELDLRVPPRKI